MTDYSSTDLDWVIAALQARPMTVAEIVAKTGVRLRVVLAVLRDLQIADGVRPVIRPRGAYRLMGDA